jgi:hypothetical protein
MASREGMADGLGDVWINAIAALDTPRAREILMSFIEPDSVEGSGALKTGREDVLSRRIAELAEKCSAIRSRILSLCQMSLDRAKRNLLASVVVRLGDKESLLQALYLLDDELNPDFPYDLAKAVEEAFVEHRPDEANSNSYTLHPRPANELLNRIIDMARSDPKRKMSALASLSRIELWRLEYGRPIGETLTQSLRGDYRISLLDAQSANVECRMICTLHPAKPGGQAVTRFKHSGCLRILQITAFEMCKRACGESFVGLLADCLR